MTDKILVDRELLERVKEYVDLDSHAMTELQVALSAPVHQPEPVAEVVSKYGDPEAFGEREIKLLADLSKVPYGTKLFAHPAPADAALVEALEGLIAIAEGKSQNAWMTIDRAREVLAAYRAAQEGK